MFDIITLVWHFQFSIFYKFELFSGKFTQDKERSQNPKEGKAVITINVLL